MKKLLLLMCVLLTGVSGAWATKYYRTNVRVSSITTGKKYIIYNTTNTGSYDKRFYLYGNGTTLSSKTPQNVGVTTSLIADDGYIWTLEESETDGQYYLKSDNGGKYFCGSNNTLSDSPSSLIFTRWDKMDNSKRGNDAKSETEGGFSYRAVGEFNDATDVWGIQINGGNYFNGNPGAFVTYSVNAHPFAIYEVEELEGNFVIYNKCQAQGTYIKYNSNGKIVINSETWVQQWEDYNTGIRIISGNVIAAGDAFIDRDNTYLAGQKVFTITSPNEKYLITGYYIKGKAANATAFTVTPSGKSAVTFNNTNISEVDVTGLEATSTTFEISTSGARLDASILIYYKANPSYDGSTTLRYLSDIDENKKYNIQAKEDSRGWWMVVPSAGVVNSTAKAGYATLVSDTKQQFAFVKIDEFISDNYYLYSVGEKKFISVGDYPGATGAVSYKRALVGNPVLSDNVTFYSSPYAATPTVVTIGGKYFGPSSDYNPAVINYQDTWNDNGNMAAVKEAGDFNPADARLQLLVAFTRDFIDNNTGRLGYPAQNTTSGSAYRNLYSALTTAQVYLNNGVGSNNYDDLLAKYKAMYQTSDIVMPEDGKVYSFINVQADETTMFYLNNTTVNDISTLRPVAYTEGTTVIPESGQFVCHKVADNQFVFVSKAGQYMQGASNGSTDSPAAAALSDTYNSDKQVVTITKFPGTNGGYVVLPSSGAKFSFGKVWMKTNKGATRNAETDFIILGNGSRFDAATGAYLYNGYSSAYYLKEADDYYNKVKLNSDGTNAYASLYLPFSVTIPSGITAYAVQSQDGTYAHMEAIVTDGTLPKNTATILKKNGQTSNTSIYLSPAVDAGSFSGTNLLGGTVATLGRDEEGTTYVLANIDGDEDGNLDGIGLYNYEGTNLAKGKAYLFIPSVGVKALTFDFGDTDGVNAIDNGQLTKDNDKVIFNLAGQRMSRVLKGVNIVNGKKVLVK